MTESTEELPGTPGKAKAPDASEVREVHPPVKFFGLDPDDDDSLYDFRPIPVSADLPTEEEVDPKDSSAPESVDSSMSETKTESESGASPTPSASAEKASEGDKGDENGTQSSSSPTSDGKTEQPAEK